MKEPTPDEFFSGNAVRLPVRGWLTVLLIAAVVLTALPAIWRTLETFRPDADYRLPYKLSEDYWLFERFCRSACRENKTIVIGDSFIWGQYVLKNQTLTHYLNERTGAGRFANLGLDGGHPLALAGLVEYYGGDIKGRNVILHLNLLWLSSPEADLQTRKELHIHHPRLIPQFFPRIPSYREPVSGRIGVVAERSVGLFGWVRHLGLMCFDGSSLQQWSLLNPYADPLQRLVPELPPSEDDRHPRPQPWTAKGQNKQSLPWVDWETSLQGRAFRRLVALLESRKNRVVIVVGPLNEHMLDVESLNGYRRLLENAEAWLKEKGLAYCLAPLLPSEFYADLSHPLDRGYEILAGRLATRYEEKVGKSSGR